MSEASVDYFQHPVPDQTCKVPEDVPDAVCKKKNKTIIAYVFGHDRWM